MPLRTPRRSPSLPPRRPARTLSDRRPGSRQARDRSRTAPALPALADDTPFEPDAGPFHAGLLDEDFDLDDAATILHGPIALAMRLIQEEEEGFAVR